MANNNLEKEVAKFNPNEYWESRLSKKTNLEGVGFLKLGIGFNKWGYRARKFVFKRLFNRLKLDASNWNVIDLGSGVGFYIALWKELGAKNISGADLTTAAYNELKTKFPGHQFYKLDLGEDLPANMPGNFDAVSCLDVLFHIVDDARFEKAVSNIASLLKSGGYFFYSDAFLHDREVRAEWQVCRKLDDLEKIFHKHGFEIVTRRPFLFLLNGPADSTNVLLKAIWWVTERGVKTFKFLGGITGAVLYPFDIFLSSNIKEGPSLEIMILRKR